MATEIIFLTSNQYLYSGGIKVTYCHHDNYMLYADYVTSYNDQRLILFNIIVLVILLICGIRLDFNRSVKCASLSNTCIFPATRIAFPKCFHAA